MRIFKAYHEGSLGFLVLILVWPKQVILEGIPIYLDLGSLTCTERTWTGQVSRFPSCLQCLWKSWPWMRSYVWLLSNSCSHLSMRLSVVKAPPHSFGKENTLYSGFNLRQEREHESISLWLYDVTSLLFWLVHVPARRCLESVSHWSSLCNFTLFADREEAHKLGCGERHWSSRK